MVKIEFMANSHICTCDEIKEAKKSTSIRVNKVSTFKYECNHDTSDLFGFLWPNRYVLPICAFFETFLLAEQ